MADWNVGDQEDVIVRTRLIGAGQFTRDAAAEAAAIEGLGAATRRSSLAAKEHSRSSWLASQTMFTVRRTAYAATLGIAALGVGAVYTGLQFEASMEQNRISMAQFLGSTDAANRELKSLYQLAATTPFDFAGVTSAAKRFLAFGFTVQQTNDYLRTIADTAAGIGGGTDAIDRMVLAFGQMQAKGQVMGNEIRQLQELGVPALDILQKQLGLTDQQIEKIGTTGIKASVAIPALIQGLNEVYGGLSEKQSKTLIGRLTTIRDYVAQTLGTIMHPMFLWLRNDVLPTVVVITQALQQGFGKDGLSGSLDALNRSNAPQWFKDLYTFAVRFTILMGELWYVIKPVVLIIGVLAWVALKALNWALGLLERHATILKFLLAILVGRMIRLFIITVLLGEGSLFLRGVWILLRTAMLLYEAAVLVATASQWQLNIATYAFPGTWVVLAIFLVIAAIAALIIWHKEIWNYVKSNWGFLVDSWDQFKTGVMGVAGAFVWLWDKAIAIIGPLLQFLKDTRDTLREINGFQPGKGVLPDYQAGGQSGYFDFGIGTQLDRAGLGFVNDWFGSDNPHKGAVPGASGGGRGDTTIRVPVVLDRRQIGEAVAHYNSDKQARK